MPEATIRSRIIHKDPVVRQWQEYLMKAWLLHRQGKEVPFEFIKYIIENETAGLEHMAREDEQKLYDLTELVGIVCDEIMPQKAYRPEHFTFKVGERTYNVLSWEKFSDVPISYVQWGLKPQKSVPGKLSEWLLEGERNPEDFSGRFLVVMKAPKVGHKPKKAVEAEAELAASARKQGREFVPFAMAPGERERYMQICKREWDTYGKNHDAQSISSLETTLEQRLAPNRNGRYRVITREPYDLLFEGKNAVYFSQKLVNLESRNTNNVIDVHAFLFEDTSKALSFYKNIYESMKGNIGSTIRQGYIIGNDTHGRQNTVLIDGNLVICLVDPQQTSSSESVIGLMCMREKEKNRESFSRYVWKSGDEKVDLAEAMQFVDYMRSGKEGCRPIDIPMKILAAKPQAFYFRHEGNHNLLLRKGTTAIHIWKPVKSGTEQAFIRDAKIDADSRLKKGVSDDDLVKRIKGYRLSNNDLNKLPGLWFVYDNVINTEFLKDYFGAVRNPGKMVSRRIKEKNYFRKPKEDTGYNCHAALAFLFNGRFFEGQFTTPHHQALREILNEQWASYREAERHEEQKGEKGAGIILDEWRVAYSCHLLEHEIFKKIDPCRDLLTFIDLAGSEYHRVSMDMEQPAKLFALLQKIVELPHNHISQCDLGEVTLEDIFQVGKELASFVDSIYKDHPNADVQDVYGRIVEMPLTFITRKFGKGVKPETLLAVCKHQLDILNSASRLYINTQFAPLYEMVSATTGIPLPADLNK